MQQVETKLSVVVQDGLLVDAGHVAEDGDQLIITPPDRPMLDQLIDYLDARPLPVGARYTKITHLSIGFAALCVRWGSYLATLLDERSDFHPDLSQGEGSQPEGIGLVNDSEMRRLNIEISHNIARLVQVYRERSLVGFYDLLRKAYLYLPMPHQSVRRNHYAELILLTNLTIGERFPICQPLVQIPIAEADRALANMIACNTWRNGYIEHVHAGVAPRSPLQPHQRRFTKIAARKLVRDAISDLAIVPNLIYTLFDPDRDSGPFPAWPRNATALANTFYGQYGADWSRTDCSSPVVLDL